MTWQPYTPDRVAALPAICTDGSELWRVTVPLICFDIVELHLPARVMRQFGFAPTIPTPCDTGVQLHGINKKHKDKNFARVHEEYVNIWNDRGNRIVQGTTYIEGVAFVSLYMDWYRRITRMHITNPDSRPSSSAYQPASADVMLVRTILILL